MYFYKTYVYVLAVFWNQVQFTKNLGTCSVLKSSSVRQNTSGEHSAAATHISNYVHTSIYTRTAVRRLVWIFYFRNHTKIPAEQVQPAGRWLFINAVQWL
jgi:hypothetical protein